MKNSLQILSAISIGALTSVAVAAPPAWLLVEGNTVSLRVNTDSTQWRCNYGFTVHFVDGTSQSQSGQTDPVAKASNHAAVGPVLYNKAVKGADNLRWDCSEKQ